MIRELDGLKENIIKGDRLDTIINMDPTDFLIMKNQQEMLTSPQLSEYIDKQRRRGFANIKEFEIEYHKRIAMSFASFILTVIGLSLSSKKTKGTSSGNWIGIEFFIYSFPDYYFYICGEWQCTPCRCCLDTQYTICVYRILFV